MKDGVLVGIAALTGMFGLSLIGMALGWPDLVVAFLFFPLVVMGISVFVALTAALTAYGLVAFLWMFIRLLTDAWDGEFWQ